MRRYIGLLLLAFALCAARMTAQQDAPLQLVQTIPLPGVEGRMDHLAIDAARQRLFVAALGNNTLEVLDARAGRRLHSIRGLHSPQGVAYLPESNRIVVANAQGGGFDWFDGDRYAITRKVDLSDDADNVRVDVAARRLYVGFGDGALGVLEMATGRRLADVPLKGHPESFQLERSGARIFVNVPAADQIAVVDKAKGAVTAAWPLSGARANFPMALDEANRRLFVGCRDPAKLLVYDTQSGRVTAALDIAGDTDDLFYDAARKRLYVSCGAGFLDIVQQQDADHYARLARIPTAAGARTSLFAPELGRLYLAVPHRGSQQAEIRVYAAQ
jgi:DNA-binding beta-propeller fold protein YncE